jgi:ribonuclease Y
MAFWLPLIAGLLAGGAAFALGLQRERSATRRAKDSARRTLTETQAEAHGKAKEILVAAQEKVLVLEEEADRREREFEGREAAVEAKARRAEREAADLARRLRDLERRQAALVKAEESAAKTETEARETLDKAKEQLERVAGLTVEQARAELTARIEEEARREAAQITRRIEDEAREAAHREARNLIVQAAEAVDLREVMESTVTFVRLPNDEMKGRIIGREGRNIRAIETATGIDLVVDDTPRAILVSCFDPIRREVARQSIERLVEDGRIHPARIEEVVAKVREELESTVEEAGSQAAFALGIPDLHPRLCKLVGRMRYRTHHGQNLLAHCQEVALIAGHMADELGAKAAVVRRAGLLHEAGRVDETSSGNPILVAAELAGRLGESEEVVHAIQSLHSEVAAKSIEALLVATANRISDHRPGARKENLEVFIERLRRLELLAASYPGVTQAFAVKAGKELRVILDAKDTTDEQAYALSKEVARRIERELQFPGQIKVSVVRETRAVQFAV